MSFNATNPHDLKHLPPQIDLFNSEVTSSLISARAQLGELKGFSDSLPNPLLLLSPAIVKESLASSEIENINTTLIDVLENQIFPEVEQQTPDKEVLRYRDAILWGFKSLESFSLSTRLIVGMQNTLMPNAPKGYRQEQNAIEDKTKREIIYTPPVQIKIPELMGNLEKYINANSSPEVDPLLRTIIGHYQFEAIHPFGDGNGRTGRILMVLGLVEHKLLDLPILYISGYINDNKNEYYKRLLEVTTEGKWREYLLFMLRGFSEQAKITKNYIFQIKNHYFEMKNEIRKKNSRLYSADLVEALFSNPILTPTSLAELIGVHYTTASKYLQELEKMGILVNKKVGVYQLYANKRLIELLH